VAKTYRIIQQWNHWVVQALGKNILFAEHQALSALLTSYFGKNAVLIGVPNQFPLLSGSKLPFTYVMSPLLNRDKNIRYIEGEYYNLPIQTASVDQVILPHTLEFLDNPHHLLLEACRIIKPEGRIFILGFNPFSFWGVKKYLMKHKNIPWSGNFLPPSTVKKWLTLADFELERQEMIVFRPPLKNQKIYDSLNFLEWIGKKCYKPFGGVYILQAKAKVIPLTPIRLNWTQELSGVAMNVNTLPGSSIRNRT
jgi:SAM-dependent methyltransferase